MLIRGVTLPENSQNSPKSVADTMNTHHPWSARYFTGFLLDKWTGPYYLSNLYDLFYASKDQFDTGDWFGEIFQAISNQLQHLKINKFQPNWGTRGARWYVLTKKNPYFPYEPVSEEEFRKAPWDITPS